MNYKATFKPCELLDSSTNEWVTYDERLQNLLNSGQRAHFKNADLNYAQTWPLDVAFEAHDMSAALPNPIPLGFMSKSEVYKRAAEWLVLNLSEFPPTLTTLQVRS